MAEIKVAIFSRIGLSERNDREDHIKLTIRTRLRVCLYNLSMAVKGQPLCQVVSTVCDPSEIKIIYSATGGQNRNK